jgi:hypothetical protein
MRTIHPQIPRLMLLTMGATLLTDLFVQVVARAL